MKVFVITPYYKESIEVLSRCHMSVLAQQWSTTTDYQITHVMVSDGGDYHPEMDTWNILHIKGPCHNDFGDTPRAIGSLSAITKGAEALIFLDADNWLEPDHVQTMASLQQHTGSHFVTSTRNLRRQDGSELGVCTESDGTNFNDTNCYFLTAPTFGALMAWVIKDPRDAIVGDRLFWATLLRVGFTHAHSVHPTVNYTTNFACHYQAFGEQPPPDSKVIVRFEGRKYSQVVSFEDYVAIAQRQKELPPSLD